MLLYMILDSMLMSPVSEHFIFMVSIMMPLGDYSEVQHSTRQNSKQYILLWIDWEIRRRMDYIVHIIVVNGCWWVIWINTNLEEQKWKIGEKELLGQEVYVWTSLNGHRLWRYFIWLVVVYPKADTQNKMDKLLTLQLSITSFPANTMPTQWAHEQRGHGSRYEIWTLIIQASFNQG